MKPLEERQQEQQRRAGSALRIRNGSRRTGMCLLVRSQAARSAVLVIENN